MVMLSANDCVIKNLLCFIFLEFANNLSDFCTCGPIVFNLVHLEEVKLAQF